MRIERGNAIDLVQAHKQERFDLLVSDPPYSFGGGPTEHALSATVATALRESAQLVHPGGYAVIFSASSWRSLSFIVEAMRGVMSPVRIATWAKPQARTKVRTPGWSWNSVDVILFRPCQTKSIKRETSSIPDFILMEPIRNGRRAALPLAVANWAVEPFAVPGGKALDPFTGTGALLLAAESFGMTGLGFELGYPENHTALESVLADAPTVSEAYPE